MISAWVLGALLAAAPVVEAPRAACGAPSYPAAEKFSGQRGTVKLRVTLSAEGTTTDRAVVTSFGPAFDDAALASLSSCRFTAGRVDGVAVPSIVELTVEFVPPVLPWTLVGDVVGELGEPLPGANVSLADQATVTDAQGRFQLTFTSLPSGDAWVVVEAAGYALKGFPETFVSGRTTTTHYALVKRRGFETRVEGSRLLPGVPDADKTPQVSHFSLTRADIDRTPGALEDISRVVQQLPGVAADPDLLANFFVRGGGPDETVYTLDGVPLTNPYHLGGFASIINPLMLESADFYAGAAPARYEPGLSGVLDLHYAWGEVKRPKVVADVSFLTAKARADVPLFIDGLSAVVSFRRSYFELYFAVLKAFKLFGTNVVAPDITEATARVTYRRGIHRTALTFIHASDGFDFVVKPGEEVLINFSGNLKLANTAQIASLRHEIDLPGDSEASFTAAYVHDANDLDVQSQRSIATQAIRHEALARGDLRWVFSAQNKSGVGVQYAWRGQRFTGALADSRAVAPWAREPIVDTGRPYLDVSPALTQSLISAYAEHTLRATEWLTFEGGARGQVDTARQQLSGSARLATSVTLPSLTVLKASGGVVWQPVQAALALDPTFGNPALLPERSVQLIAAVEQPLPFEALVRVEGWTKLMSSLVVNTDTRAALESRLAAGLPSYTNDGSGLAWGVDAMLTGRTRHFFYTAGLSYLDAKRTNPLAQLAQTYSVQWEQRFTASMGLTYSPNAKWVVTGRLNFRTGRPYTAVLGFRDDAENARWVPVFGQTSANTYPFFFEANVRAEHRFVWGPLSMALYVEVLNLTNTMNVFSWVYGPGDEPNGVVPGRGAFNHLPIRPFAGLRAEY